MFYKYENEVLMFGPTVMDAEYALTPDMLSELSLPIDGWYWFDTEDQAREFFGIPINTPQ